MKSTRPTTALIPDGPEGAAVRDAYLADERETLVALAAQVTQTTRRCTPSRHRPERGWKRCATSGQHGGIESFLQHTTCRRRKAYC